MQGLTILGPDWRFMEPERNTRRNLEFIPGVPHPVEDPPPSTNGVNMEFSEAKRLLSPYPLPL